MTHIPAPYQAPWDYKLIKPVGTKMEGLRLPAGIRRLCPTIPIPRGYEEVETYYSKAVKDEDGKLDMQFCALKRWREPRKEE